MTVWIVVVIIVAAWCALSVVVALIVGRAVKLGEIYERGPTRDPDRPVPDPSVDNPPTSIHGPRRNNR